MNDIWEKIRSDYQKAKYALWCPKGVGTWSRDEETGRYYMWKAYHQAYEAEPKDDLLFARILAMMAGESHISVFDYDRYHKFVKPSLDAYERAIKAGQHPTEKEMESIRFNEKSLAYVLEQHKTPYEEQIKHINRYERLENFYFHDSEAVWFEHTKGNAKLKLEYDDMIVTFLFEDILEIETIPKFV